MTSSMWGSAASEYDYTTLPSMAEASREEEEDDDRDASTYAAGSSPNGESEGNLLLKERARSLRIDNLDAWFTSLYDYYHDKGFYCIVTSRVVNLLTLGFTIVFSAWLLLFVDWRYLSTECAEDARGRASAGAEGTCDVLRDATFASPLSHRSTLANVVVVTYLLIFSLYWTWSLARLATDLRPLLEMRSFCNNKLQLSDRDVQTVEWPEVVARVVHLQATTRLCITKDLNEHDIVARIMRKENYLLGMINRDVLGLTLTGLPGARRTRWLTTCVRWNLEWAVFHGMFDDDFSIRPSFYDVRALRKRMRTLAVINLVLSPFIAIFMATYFALRDAERFYRHPAAVGARSWSPESRWKLREFNELKHFHEHRLTAAHKHATKYLSQFPSPVVSMIAKFVSYVVGAFAAMCIACALIDDDLLHAEVFGRDLLWHTAVLGTLLAASRGMIGEANKVFEPNRLMAEVVSHTHYLPRRWRDAAHKAEVQAEFEEMFPFKAATFAKEMLSIFVAPFVLWYPLCESAPEIVSFVRNFTVHRQGVGDVCSLSAFDFRRHGNAKYGAGTTARKPARSKQGKMEKSFLSFHAQYPTWEPDEGGREVIASLNGFKCSAAPVVPGRGGSLPGSPRRAAAAAARSRAKSPTAFAAPGSASMFLDDAIGASNFPRSLAASTATAAGEDDADAETEYQVTLQRFYDWNRATGWHPGTPPSRGDSPNELELGGGVDDRDARRGRSPTRSVDARRLETEMRAAVVVASRRPSDPDPCPDDLFAASPPTPSRMTDSGTLLGENLDAGDPLAALGSLPSPRGDVREPANPWDMDATAREWGRGGGV